MNEFTNIASLVEEDVLVSSDNYIDYPLLEDILRGEIYTRRYRVMLLNPDETVNTEIPQEDIIIDDSNYSENYQNGSRRSLTLGLVNIDKLYSIEPNKIWIQNKFRYDVGIEWNGQVVWMPRGIFVMDNPNSLHGNSNLRTTLSLTDKFSVLEGTQGTLEGTYEIPVGSDIESAINGILNIQKGDGYPLDCKPIYYDVSFKGLKMPYTLTKDAGSSFGEMILEIADILNAECYYNAYGTLCFYPIDESTLDVNKPIVWDVSDTDGNVSNINPTYDFSSAVNVVQIVGDNVENKVIPSAMLSNEDPASPLCVGRIGRRVKYVNDSAISSQERALDRAKYELRKASILNTTITFTMPFNPLLFVNNVITITDSHFGWIRAKALIQSISYSFNSGGVLSITASNLDNFGGGTYDARWYK